MSERDLAEATAMIADAASILFITGAGISADSGLPTYRGVGGLYDDADTDDGVPIEEALSGPMFRARPELTWKHIAVIELTGRGVVPNAGHRAIVALERSKPRVFTLTQNVDGLHAAAGSQNLIEIHGNIHTLDCPRCGASRSVPDYGGLAIPPLCAACGAIVRPRVVLFEEALPVAAVEALHRELATGFDLVVSVGTTSSFPYIAGPVLAAAEGGVPTLEINPGETILSGVVDVHLKLRAADALSAVAARLGLVV